MPKTIKVPANFKQITIRWPDKIGIPAMSGQWHRLPDGRIEATYTREEFEVICKNGLLDLNTSLESFVTA